MTQKVTAQQLLRGSRNIDQMRRDIDQTVSMILGFLELLASKNFKRRQLSLRDARRWTVQRLGNEIVAEFASNPVIVYESDQPRRLAAASVELVYDHLDDLVNGVLSEFQELEVEVKPFLKAAEK